jgi:hypothetical protein
VRVAKARAAGCTGVAAQDEDHHVGLPALHGVHGSDPLPAVIGRAGRAEYLTVHRGGLGRDLPERAEHADPCRLDAIGEQLCRRVRRWSPSAGIQWPRASPDLMSYQRSCPGNGFLPRVPKTISPSR